MIRRALLRASASLALLTLLGLTASAQTGGTPNCKSGQGAGAWNLPAAGQPGAMRGALVSEGTPQFGVQAALVPDATPSATGRRSGTMMGVLSVPTPSGPMPIARLQGQWTAGRDGRGKFRAAFLRPGPTAGSPVRLLGRMQGAFDDSTPGSAGNFRARWQICR